MISVRSPAPSDEAAWRALWAGYTAFYGVEIADETTAFTWRRMLDPSSPVFGRLAVNDRAVVGFSVSLLHEGTWTATPTCYLEDLFVAPEARGLGAGRALIQDLVEIGHAKGWSRLYWHTRADNPARRLYDEFARADDFVRYRLALD